MTNRGITLYTTNWCHDCYRARRYLQSQGIRYREIDMDRNPQAAASAPSSPLLPQPLARLMSAINARDLLATIALPTTDSVSAE